ncbi:MAG: 30S ribosomal protein S7 [Flavobacteriaceae bacterium]
MRKRVAKKRILLPDPKFNDQLVTRFVNNMMLDGKKSTAFKVFYDAMDIVESKKAEGEEKSSLEIWKDALSNVMPHVEVRSRRVGGATYQIPMQIRADRKVSMAIKWLILYARKRNEKSMAQRLAGEVIAASKEEGSAYKKRVDVHKMAEANKAFSHFRF